MSWFSRFDRFGSGHMVRSQDRDMSCGMSSMCMINFKMKKGLMFAGMAAGAGLSVVPIPGASYLGSTLFRSAIDYAVASEDEVIAAYDEVEGGHHDFDHTGADPTLYPAVLRKLGLGEWERVDVGEAGITQAVIDATDDGSAVMVGVSWDGGGGHAVVIDETHSFFGTRYLCVCDPWDGELRLITAAPGSTVVYDGNYRPISTHTWFGGDIRGPYDPTKNNRGKLNGGITRLK
jgi:hypothetical protein